MARSFGDRITAAVAERGTPTCVGLDPVYGRLPEPVRARYGDEPSRAAAAEAIYEFGRGVIEAVAPLVPVMKINVAFFELSGAPGIEAYQRLVGAARDAGLLVIGDVKRADIGHSTAAYAEAQLAGPGGPDAVTVNPYLGLDGVSPFIEVCRAEGKGLFVLVQTSNEAAREVQDVELVSGETVAGHVGGLVDGWAGETGLVGGTGYSAVGAVVSPRDVAGADKLRSLMPRCVFLVPGYGAQGQSAERVAHCFKADCTGAVVNSSRGVIYAYENERYGVAGADWQRSVEAACRDFVDDIRRVLGR
jgi:orotidine-5'-phosphate decarboxylase